jgi:hypothetical protein
MANIRSTIDCRAAVLKGIGFRPVKVELPPATLEFDNRRQRIVL